MLFNVYNYDKELIGQVEATDQVEAWGIAGKIYDRLFDIRPAKPQEQEVLVTREWVAFCITECNEIERAPSGGWVEAAARLHSINTNHKVIVGYEV